MGIFKSTGNLYFKVCNRNGSRLKGARANKSRVGIKERQLWIKRKPTKFTHLNPLHYKCPNPQQENKM